MPFLLATIQEDAFTREVSREAEEFLSEEAERLSPILRRLARLRVSETAREDPTNSSSTSLAPIWHGAAGYRYK
jgi:hypothetical protein